MSKHASAGAWLAIGAHTLWGLIPVYFKLVSHIPSLEVLAHRVVWSVVVTALILTASHSWPAARAVFKDWRLSARLFASALVISVNTLVYIWAVAHDQVVAASLGYFITPLASMALGYVVLSERLRPMQWLAIALAVAAVMNEILQADELPWVVLVLALAFAIYGLIRKTTPVESSVGLFVETTFMAPFALAYLVWLSVAGVAHFAVGSFADNMLLAGLGIVTATPLLLFAAAARRARLVTLGFIFYITPVMQLGLGVLAYNEPFGAKEAVTLGLILLALAIYTNDTVRATRASATTRATSGETTP